MYIVYIMYNCTSAIY